MRRKTMIVTATNAAGESLGFRYPIKEGLTAVTLPTLVAEILRSVPSPMVKIRVFDEEAETADDLRVSTTIQMGTG